MRLFLTIIFTALSLSVQSQERTLKLTSDIWPPFTDIEGQRTIAFDIVETALERIGTGVDYEIQNFSEVIEGINKKQYDGSAALWINESRKKILLFSEPYLQNQLILVGRKGAEVDIDDLKLLNGRKIGIISDYAYGDSLSNKGVDWVYGKSDQENLDLLLAGQLDYILVEALLIQYLLKNQLADVRSYLAVGSQPLILRTLHFALRKDIPGAKKFISAFDQEIREMVKDGSYNNILALEWINADVDGDGVPEYILDGPAAGVEAPSNTYSVFYSKPAGNLNRYYINGQVYEGWENVPSESRIEIPQVAPEYEGKGELKLRIK